MDNKGQIVKNTNNEKANINFIESLRLINSSLFNLLIFF